LKKESFLSSMKKISRRCWLESKVNYHKDTRFITYVSAFTRFCYESVLMPCLSCLTWALNDKAEFSNSQWLSGLDFH
jgi:hypothetical protein